MTQQPKVSVLISFYNLAPFVDQTMESVLAQKTDFPVEILCADDGSDDGTVEKLRRMGGSAPRHRPRLCHGPRAGQKNMRATSASGG